MNYHDDEINFHVNGRPYAVKTPEVEVSLNSWLRTTAKLTGTKVMCKEGGCGACVVMVTLQSSLTGDSKAVAVNSCLLPLLSVDGYHITTTEGLIERGGKYNAIQERLAYFGATQCGYCTPGYVMAMHSLLQRNPSPTQEEIEEEFDGNLCRCTGYRPIFEAMKSFATDADPKFRKICADIEDLKSCQKDCQNWKSCGRYNAEGTREFSQIKKNYEKPTPLKSLALRPKQGAGYISWLRPANLQELVAKVKEYVQLEKSKIRYVVGYTSISVFKDEEQHDLYVDTKLTKELYEVTDSEEFLKIGANLTLNELITLFWNHTSESEIFSVMAKHLKKIANVPVRNVACWTGNLMLKKTHPEFPSDVFTLFSAFSVKIIILDCISGTENDYKLTGDHEFMSIDMKGKVIVAAKIPKWKSSKTQILKVASYKVMPRSQNAHAYVNCAFLAHVEDGKISNPCIAFGGIHKEFVHAKKLEKFLNGKDINSQKTLSDALEVLQVELQPSSCNAADSSPEYRRSVSLGLFYKFFLHLCDGISSKVTSAIKAIDRPVTTSNQIYSSDATMFPVTQPLSKVSAIKQASGEAKYISDLMPAADELWASFVMADVGNADIDVIDTMAAEKLPGFHSIITASDLLPDIKNTYISPPHDPQMILADKHVEFAGQPIAIVLADSVDYVEAITKSIKVTYKNRRPVVCDVEEAIKKNMFYDNLGDHLEVGNPAQALKNTKNKVCGRIRLGSQYHFYMETQIARAVPTEDGFDVECATQWQNGIQLSCAHILGWDCNRINVRTARIGGSFGGKAKTSLLTGSIAVIASYITGRTVRFHSTLSQCMETYGSRPAYVVDYTVGFNDCGLLDVIEATYFTNSGVSANDSDLRAGALKSLADGGYRCSNWNLTSRNVKTNIPSNAWCRAPMSAQLSAVMEIILEHVAKSLKEDPIKIKIRNLYKENEIELFGTTLEHFKLREISEALLASAKAAERQLEHDAFNRKNKWKKRGMGFMPMKFPVTYQARWFSTQVSILSNDGTVILTCGGANCGQGLSTKLIQVASFVLGVPMDLIRVAESSLVTTPNSSATSSSITSELCCVGILECCKTLKSRLADVKATMNLSDDIPWRNLIKKCFAQGVNLTANHWVFPKKDPVKRYHVCGAALSEVELDVLTGEYALRRVDILYDCGKSINPEIDIGQAEGAFMMGVGFYTSEKMSYDSITGKLVTNNTWQYKPPASKDIPTVWNITFVKDESNPAEILSSKAVGEPPLCLSASVIFAMKRCVENFKRDKSYFPIDLPATVDNVQQLCEIALTDYTIYD